jgi:hypothetical protein
MKSGRVIQEINAEAANRAQASQLLTDVATPILSGSLLNLEIKVDSIAFHQHLNESIKFARRGLVGERVPATREPMYRD